MSGLKIVYIGSVEFSERILQKMISAGTKPVAIITKEKSEYNSDFCDLSKIAITNNIPFKHVNNINHPNNVEWIANYKPDVLFCFGWSNLLKYDVLHAAPMGVIGYHPSALPNNRGRHPLIWALALGLHETGSSFFFMNEGADTGDILSQRIVRIEDIDTARSLYDKIVEISFEQVADFLPKLALGNYERISQLPDSGNVWRKRSRPDGKIDFRMNFKWINNLVRALTRPYFGAHVELSFGGDCKIWAVSDGGPAENNKEPGHVLEVRGNAIRVKCADGSVWLDDHDLPIVPKCGQYLL